ncbi:MAG: LysM peptidoglycan-binding domain-containing protein, partial [Proteobacteria bacterium]|nr:LysM peptidoglycan-binding domain-containing protein [Pseudomonadota bacterium]
MRFNWRGHSVVTALALFSVLPFVGCSSQQQAASDEVEATEGDEGNGEQNAANPNEEPGVADNGGAQNAEGENQAPPSAEGQNVVGNNPAGQETGTGDTSEVQAMINDMGGNGASAGTPEQEEAPVADAAPANGAAPTGSAAPTAVPANPGAAPAARVAGIPEMGSKMAYVIEAGDTLGKIATRVYGDQKRWKDISNLSGLSNPNQVYPGDVVYYSLDEVSAQFAATYESITRSKEIVRQGDSLASI